MITPPTLYFGYGSNLWLNQMKRRCPKSIYIGLAVLKDWRWIISSRHYANVVPSPGDVAYGEVYQLTPEDEAALDGFEGVPNSYVKQVHQVQIAGPIVDFFKKDVPAAVSIPALVYVDVVRVTEGSPAKEYIHRMNMGIADALQLGVPETYINKYLRPSIPPEN
ncbi:Butirosin biosynthesis, BtrG-like protein [Infundibulicybe gibba]|nr:Butirosin biosynthesis, BtrG-like protein [Infundibulicybe gibba]